MSSNGNFDAGVNPYRNAYYEPDYIPKATDLLCAFSLDMGGSTDENEIIEAAAAVAAESSTGTWTEVWSNQFVDLEYYKGRVYKIEQKPGKYPLVYIAYPMELFEENSIVNIMSSIVGNVFGFKAYQGLRLEDMMVPPILMKGYPGPAAGIEDERFRLDKYDRPLIGGTIKPKLGLSAKDFATVVYESLRGGLDTTKDDENLNSQPFNRWRDRFMYVMDAVKKAEAETGEKKGHWLNVTAGSTAEMLRRTEFAAAQGSRFIMVDFLTAGFTAFADVRQRAEELGLMIHVHRAMHAVIDRQKNHGINFNVLAKWLRMAGGDHLHTGTVVGKLEGSWSETVARVTLLREPRYRAADAGGTLVFDQDWAGLKNTWPVASGGIHVHNVPDLYKIFGNDAFYLFGGGTHGHPRGSRAGAEANRAAVEAIAAGSTLEAAARNNKALREAMELWSDIKFEVEA
ncbi:MAG: form I ribulose bisphosphate carboxylase large subunit [Chloroflexi bacterium]|nr:MAG: form I ribulose bisphosphate carboxylase large subunit [Chloroflexota bacterium]